MSNADFIKKMGEYAKKDMLESGILASVTIAQAILESGYGSTELAINASNYFGMKCSLSGNSWSSVWDGVSKYTKKTNEQKKDGTVYTITADFRKYPDMGASVRDHSLYLLGAKKGSKYRYEGLKGERDYRKAIQIIKDGGYATAVNYVDKVCEIIERYNLTQYDAIEEVKPMSKKLLVVLDPGHYPNYNRGAIAGYFEGDKMYDFSEYERDALKVYGIDVIITRGRSNDMDLYPRGQVAVKNGAGYDNVVFISNHSNGFNGKACGVEIFRSMHLPKSEELANKLLDAIVNLMAPVTGVTVKRGVKTKPDGNVDYYGVIRGSVSGATSEAEASRGPVKYSYIIEHGFHDNIKECTFLNNPANLKKMAEVEARVIAEYFNVSAKPEEPKAEGPKTKELYRVRKSWDDPKSQLNAYENLDNAKREADAHPGYYVFNSAGECIYPEVKDDTPFMVRVKAKDLNIRKGPGLSYAVARVCPVGSYTITETQRADGYTWGRLKSGAGWIALEHTERV